MTSDDLARRGFLNWEPFNLSVKRDLLAKLPDNTNGVYVFRDDHRFGRYYGESDIVYIGCAPKQSLRKRISLYFRDDESQRTNKRIHDKLQRIKSLEISWVPCQGEEAEAIEGELLSIYEESHQELPPFNEQRNRN